MPETRQLRDLLDDLAADLYEGGRHNEAELLEELSNRVYKINFVSPNYTQYDALNKMFDTPECDCERCPECGGLING